MSTVGNSIVAMLSANTAITQVVGQNITQQYTLGDPMPRIVITTDDIATPATNHDGPAGLRMSPVTIGCMAKPTTGTAANAVVSALAQAAFSALCSSFVPGTYAGTYLQAVQDDGGYEEGELTPTDTGSQGRILYINLRLNVWYSTATI